jgi:formamidopyrimidine-DNA glycosylase
MPELPEVETTMRGIEPFLAGRRIREVVLRRRDLRWPIPAELPDRLTGARVESLSRRAKYILMRTDRGCLIMHLGMSGSLRVVTSPRPPAAHDHVDLVVPGGTVVRYRDPRRFGCFLWTEEDPFEHPLLRRLGPEPLDDAFDGAWLYRMSRGRKVAVKSFIMDSGVVVGVGNIYASEALSRAGIHPLRAAGRVSLSRYESLVAAVKFTLERSIGLGGTTLRDFVNPSGSPGYFEQTLRVYGRAGLPCRDCGKPLRQSVVGQRSTFYCANCQR